ncbi:serine/threonine-protein kinase [Actinoplanes subtropicus]|uniref:serine/threonine-protein kinase n=1 Tax=Actinoplanes subtropicus TaxID=543632 RepID=UPI00069119CB|nr:serine/threonine-protein kinase [Actinoplanes subtropicus]
MSDHVLGGRYHLQRPLGHGATATVWEACDTRLERNAAVKILDARSRADPAALERLRREARSVARLDHDNIVGMYDVDVADDAAYLVMELVDGRSLAEIIARQGRLPVERAVSIAAQVCDALGAAHAAGVVHRDIKPSNILVDAAGVVKVCDFGVALLDRAAGETALTGADLVVGTCQYMAPEQAAGDPVDGRADLYAVGCVLYAMLAGAPPFVASHPIDVLELHLSEPPVPLRAFRADLPPDLHRLVDELLEKHAADRPESAWAARDRLRALGAPTAFSAPSRGPGAGSGTAAVVSPTRPLPAVTGRHRRWPLDRTTVLVAGGVVAAVLATALVFTLVTGRGTPAPAASPPDAGIAVAAPPAEPSTEPPSDPASDPAGTGSSAAPTAASPAPRPGTAMDRLAGLAAILQREADAGTLRPKVAKALLHDLEGVARQLDNGNTDQAAERFDDFRDRVSELRDEDELGGVALPDLDAIAGALHAG